MNAQKIFSSIKGKLGAGITSAQASLLGFLSGFQNKPGTPKKKIPVGLMSYIILIVWFFWPGSEGEGGGNFFLSFFLAIAILLALTGLAFLRFTVNAKNIVAWIWGSTVVGAFGYLVYQYALPNLPWKELFEKIPVGTGIAGTILLVWLGQKIYGMQKGRPAQAGTAPVAPSGTAVQAPGKQGILSDGRLYFAFLLLGILATFNMNLFGNGGVEFEGYVAPVGQIYIPLTGLLYYGITWTALTTLMSVGNKYSQTLLAIATVVSGVILTIISWMNGWFFAYGEEHVVYHKFLSSGVMFPSDPLVPWWWVPAGVFALLVILHKGRHVPAFDFENIVRFVAVTVFIPGLWNQFF